MYEYIDIQDPYFTQSDLKTSFNLNSKSWSLKLTATNEMLEGGQLMELMIRETTLPKQMFQWHRQIATLSSACSVRDENMYHHRNCHHSQRAAVGFIYNFQTNRHYTAYDEHVTHQRNATYQSVIFKIMWTILSNRDAVVFDTK